MAAVSGGDIATLVRNLNQSSVESILVEGANLTSGSSYQRIVEQLDDFAKRLEKDPKNLENPLIITSLEHIANLAQAANGVAMQQLAAPMPKERAESKASDGTSPRGAGGGSIFRRARTSSVAPPEAKEVALKKLCEKTNVILSGLMPYAIRGALNMGRGHSISYQKEEEAPDSRVHIESKSNIDGSSLFIYTEEDKIKDLKGREKRLKQVERDWGRYGSESVCFSVEMGRGLEDLTGVGLKDLDEEVKPVMIGANNEKIAQFVVQIPRDERLRLGNLLATTYREGEATPERKEELVFQQIKMYMASTVLMTAQLRIPNLGITHVAAIPRLVLEGGRALIKMDVDVPLEKKDVRIAIVCDPFKSARGGMGETVQTIIVNPKKATVS